MNSKQLRQSLRIKWLTYYRDNRDWIDRLGIWITSNGHRRPSSGFILGVLSTLEPNLNELLPLVVDLSSNPDRIIIALGLNISPDKELEALIAAKRMLPSSNQPEAELSSPIGSSTPQPVTIEAQPAKPVRHQDEECRGSGGRDGDRPR